MQRSAVLVAAVVITALSAGATQAVQPARAAGEEPAICRGLAATIVGSPGETVQGTAEADVIVTNGAHQVEAGAGDDLVCTTNTPPDRHSLDRIKVLAGTGDDVVDRSGDPDPAASSLTFLDEGDDIFVGGPAEDHVNSTDAGADTIDTGAGDDEVVTGYLDGWGPTGADVIDLGDGDDHFLVEGPVSHISPDLSISGGAGGDTLQMSISGGGHWVLDAAGAEATFRGADSFGFAEIERYSLYAPDARTSGFRFVGTQADERVGIAPAQAADGADLGGGDDVMLVSSPSSGRRAPSAPYPIVGGPGVDRIEVPAMDEDVRLSLAGRRLDFRFDNAGEPDYAVLGFEDARAISDRVRITGDAGPNTLTWHACRGAVRSGGGDDTVRWLHGTDARSCVDGTRLRVAANAGDDTVVGGPYDDLLVGGPGLDVAIGRTGRDRCRAETTRSCETG